MPVFTFEKIERRVAGGMTREAAIPAKSAEAAAGPVSRLSRALQGARKPAAKAVPGLADDNRKDRR